MAIDDNTVYGLTGAQVKDLAAKVKGGEDPSKEYSFGLTFFSKWEQRYVSTGGYNCTVKSVDFDKMEAFLKAHPSSWMISFDYREKMDEEWRPTGEYAWSYRGDDFREMYISPEEMLEITGIDVELEEGAEEYASFYLEKEVVVDKTSEKRYIYHEIRYDGGETFCFSSPTAFSGEFKDSTGQTWSIPACAIHTASAQFNLVSGMCPNDFLAFAVNAMSLSVSAAFIGNNVMRQASTQFNESGQAGGENYVTATVAIGDGVLSGAHIRALNGYRVNAPRIGDSFMSGAKYGVSSNLSIWCPASEVGEAFCSGLQFCDYSTGAERKDIGAVVTANDLPNLTAVGRAFYSSTPVRSMVIPSLMTAGEGFLQGNTFEKPEYYEFTNLISITNGITGYLPPFITLPSLEFVDRTFFCNSGILTSETTTLYMPKIKSMMGPNSYASRGNANFDRMEYANDNIKQNAKFVIIADNLEVFNDGVSFRNTSNGGALYDMGNTSGGFFLIGKNGLRIVETIRGTNESNIHWAAVSGDYMTFTAGLQVSGFAQKSIGDIKTCSEGVEVWKLPPGQYCTGWLDVFLDNTKTRPVNMASFEVVSSSGPLDYLSYPVTEPLLPGHEVRVILKKGDGGTFGSLKEPMYADISADGTSSGLKPFNGGE